MSHTISGELTSYAVTINANQGDKRASIRLVSQPAATICYLDFYVESAELPDNRLVVRDNGSNQLYISQRYSDYLNILDLVRNEKPVNFLYRHDGNLFFVRSGNEPIGEHEFTV